MPEFKNSRTCGNLMKAFAGESQARNRYTYYASVARKEGYHQIAEIFTETAENEKEHAKLFMKALLKHGMNEQMVEINGACYPVAFGDTLKNLGYAADGEKEEWTAIYHDFAKIAEEEGYKDVATIFKMVGQVEKRHEARYRKLAENIKKQMVFKRDQKVGWICRNCGHVHEGNEAPATCPVCDHPREFFQLFVEAY